MEEIKLEADTVEVLEEKWGKFIGYFFKGLRDNLNENDTVILILFKGLEGLGLLKEETPVYVFGLSQLDDIQEVIVSCVEEKLKRNRSLLSETKNEYFYAIIPNALFNKLLISNNPAIVFNALLYYLDQFSAEFLVGEDADNLNEAIEKYRNENSEVVEISL